MSRKEKEIRDAKELFYLMATVVISMAFILGIWFGETTAIHNCYMVTENESSYVLNFNGIEHLYLKDTN